MGLNMDVLLIRAAEKMQSATASGWQQARDLTSEGIKRLYGGPLEVHRRFVLLICPTLFALKLFTRIHCIEEVLSLLHLCPWKGGFCCFEDCRKC